MTSRKRIHSTPIALGLVGFSYFISIIAFGDKRRCVILKRKLIVISWAFVLMAGAFWGTPSAQADMEWRVFQHLDLKATPLDVASSADGQRLFVLTPGEILVFSSQDGKIVDRVSIGKDFDRITSMPGGQRVTISSSKKKTIQILTFEMVYKIDVTGLPFKGPENAPVTLAVFDDYQ